jgi:hypothetical protein
MLFGVPVAGMLFGELAEVVGMLFGELAEVVGG